MEQLKSDISKLAGRQIDFAKELFTQYFSFDEAEDNSEKKSDVYSLYIEEISDLIAKYEVSCRDLPRDAVALIEYVFRLISSSVLNDDVNEKDKIYNTARCCEIYLINLMHLKLVNSYINKTKQYLKIFKRFNHSGIYVDIDDKKEAVVSYMKKSLKTIKKHKRMGNKLFKCSSEMTDNDIKIPIPVKKCDMIYELKKAFTLSEELLLVVEEKYPDVLNNGYTRSFWVNLILKIPEIVSYLIIILSIIIFIKKWM